MRDRAFWASLRASAIAADGLVLQGRATLVRPGLLRRSGLRGGCHRAS